jgi:RNA polymerase sigma-70 factor, ECF subfamily
MQHADVGLTSSSQLRAVSDWANHSAWTKVKERYEPLLHRCCAHLGLHGADADDVLQETWIAVANRMKTFAYDPRGTFRGWLWKVCHHEAIDFLKRKQRDQAFLLDERDECVRLIKVPVDLDEPRDEQPECPLPGDETVKPALARLFAQAEEIQAAVRPRVKTHTWEAFWLVGVMLWSVADTAKHLQISNALVYKAQKRVLKMLQDEARRRFLLGIDSRPIDPRSE